MTDYRYKAFVSYSWADAAGLRISVSLGSSAIAAIGAAPMPSASAKAMDADFM